ncbi:unnamed protein product [Mytilus coruscus]|uniref:Novel STAND NTPase 3 domain-containing protein n=1 Tax=Mytilus coruscus TaxID=42192 RepID=A0A6J8BB21_MYTCO|nr:unnamed protein product [Mytilus coruscus]
MFDKEVNDKGCFTNDSKEELYIYQESDQPTQSFNNSAYIQDFNSKVVAKTGEDVDPCDIYDEEMKISRSKNIIINRNESIVVRIGGKNDPGVKETSLNTVTKKQVQKILDGLKEKEENSSLKEKIIKMETELEEVIPKNIRDQIQTQIEDWEKKDKMFVSTRASDYVMEQLQDNSCLTLTAPSGVGKSFIARHTALILKKEGYNIIPVELPADIKTYYQPGKKTVFIVDDICGNFTANQQQIENWKQLLPVINTIIADKCCKIIVSCRLQVYKDDKFNILSPFKSCECNLISDKLCLTSVEKTNIANAYIGTKHDRY